MVLEMTQMDENMTRAEQLINMMTDILGKDAASKSRVRVAFNKYKTKMNDGDARLFAALTYLRKLLDDNPESQKQ